jgi:hypothetical protein
MLLEQKQLSIQRFIAYMPPFGEVKDEFASVEVEGMICK